CGGRGDSVTILDCSQQCPTPTGISYVVCDLNGDWPLPTSSMDAVVSLEVIEHVEGAISNVIYGLTDGYANRFKGKVAEFGIWNQGFSASNSAKASAMCQNQYLYWATVTAC